MNQKEEKEFRIIAQQIRLIKGINRDIEISKEMGSPFMVKQYEHLKKEYVKNLFKMLAENYQIPIPTIAKKEAA